MAITRIKKLPDDVVTTGKVETDTLVNADFDSSAEIAQSKISGLTTSLSIAVTKLVVKSLTIIMLQYK